MSLGLSLFLLAMSLGVAVAGLWIVLTGSAREDDLLARTLDLDQLPAHQQLRAAVNERLAGTKLGNRMESELRGGDLTIGPGDLLMIIIGLGAAAFLLTSFVIPAAIALLVGLAASYMAWRWVVKRREQRSERFLMQLPDLARILSNASAAGLSMVNALGVAGRELENPAGAELKLVAQRMALGERIDDALDFLRGRVPTKEVGVLVSTLVIQQRAGGDMVKALTSIAFNLQARNALRDEVRTATSEPRFGVLALAGMTLIMVIVIDKTMPGTLDSMVSNPIGIVVIAVVVAGFVGLGLLIRRLGKIDV